jgi:aryl-alcohol dehydrogenase-like predicted oxidoreductase
MDAFWRGPKVANPVGLGPLEAGLSARHLEVELEGSLRRLKTDRIDLVLAHRWDPGVAVEVWRVFDRWVRSGKVLCVGVSNWPTWRVAQVGEIAAKYGWAPVSASSPMYNLLHRGAELEHFPCANHYNIAVIPYQPFMGGILTGKYQRGQAPVSNSRRAEKPGWLPALDDRIFGKLEALEALAQEAGIPLTEYVIAWLLSRKGVRSIIVGSRTPQQLDAVIGGVERTVPADHFPRIDSIFPAPVPYGGEKVLQWRNNAWTLENAES